MFVVTGIRDTSREREYQEEGQPVTAVVVSKSIRRATRDGNSSTRYEIAYRFTTEDGRTMEGVDAVDVEEWERLEPGRPFRITYLPGAPASSRAEGSDTMASSLIATGLGSTFALVGGVIFLVSARRVRREWRLLREGQSGQGTVTAIEPTNVSINRRRQWRIRYRYQDHLGRVHAGTSGPVSPTAVEAIAVGDPVDIRFDRAYPEESVWVRPSAAAAEQDAVEAPVSRPRQPSLRRRLRNLAIMLAILFVALVVGESVPALKALDRFSARHESALLAMTIFVGFIGFALFMGGILYRIFGGAGQPMSHADVESRSAGSSFGEGFSLKEAKAAWRQRAWRTSPRWRGNFIVMSGALLLTVGLFGIFVVT
ncbi:MAG: DUF3592 domain-containing protein, partial [Actinobacteria bacterium]|nr:DUF3592 domain-containing protein [Actinomycetota bacterium]